MFPTCKPCMNTMRGQTFHSFGVRVWLEMVNCDFYPQVHTGVMFLGSCICLCICYCGCFWFLAELADGKQVIISINPLTTNEQLWSLYWSNQQSMMVTLLQRMLYMTDVRECYWYPLYNITIPLHPLVSATSWFRPGKQNAFAVSSSFFIFDDLLERRFLPHSKYSWCRITCKGMEKEQVITSSFPQWYFQIFHVIDMGVCLVRVEVESSAVGWLYIIKWQHHKVCFFINKTGRFEYRHQFLLQFAILWNPSVVCYTW